MRPIIRRGIQIVVVFVALILLSWYRSLIGKTDFLHGFDSIFSTSISELWKVITNPIALTAIAIIIALHYTRSYLPNVMPWISEVKFGEISAKFSASKLTSDSGSTAKPSNATTKIEDKELIEKVVSNFGRSTCWVLLRLADRPLTTEEIINIIADEIEERRGKLEGATQLERIALCFGYLLAMGNTLSGMIFDVEDFEEKGEAKQDDAKAEKVVIRISPATKEMLFKQAQMLTAKM